MKKLITINLFLSITAISFADIRLPAVLGSNMILQQQSTVKLWGWYSPVEKILVTTSWNNKTDSVVATRDANWQINIQTPSAGCRWPVYNYLERKNQIVLDNVLIGEVWVCPLHIAQPFHIEAFG